MAKKHLQHIKSSQANKIPTAADLMYGEIAVNYANGSEQLFIKNSNDEIVPFVSVKVIEDNELVTAGALAQLNERLGIIEDNKPNLDNLEDIKYSQLTSKVNNGELVPGKYYKIIDYTTTTVQKNTQSAGHQFDVVVLALDESTLSENAHAMLHDGDTYFSTNKADLNPWELKYCLDNDTDRFAWADSVNGKGVIYYMKDEWSNECPYDFKNIQFKRKLSNGALDTAKGVDTFVYTFNLWRVNTEEIEDASIIGNTLKNDGQHINGVYGNKINPVSEYTVISEQPPFEVTQYLLNDNVFLNFDDGDGFYGCYTNILGYDCTSNTFGNECSSNTIGNDCHSNSFGEDVCYNTFGYLCRNNSFGNSCHFNLFGNGCDSNSFGNECSSNSFGNVCSFNLFGDECSSNSFENGCNSNSFGDNCNYNTFGSSCQSNSFGYLCRNNSFGNAVNHVTFSKNYTYYVIVENGNQYITLTSTAKPTSENPLRNITIAQGVNNTTANKTISHDSIGDAFKTTYQPANSVVVNL